MSVAFWAALVGCPIYAVYKYRGTRPVAVPIPRGSGVPTFECGWVMHKPVSRSSTAAFGRARVLSDAILVSSPPLVGEGYRIDRSGVQIRRGRGGFTYIRYRFTGAASDIEVHVSDHDDPEWLAALERVGWIDVDTAVEGWTASDPEEHPADG